MSVWDDVANVSAQSPPCSRNALPRATAASRSRSWSTSEATTNGGMPARVSAVSRRTTSSGQFGCWAAGRARQASRPGSSTAVTPYLGLLAGSLTGSSVGDRHRRLPSAEEDLGLGVHLRLHRLELGRRVGEGDPDDVGAAERDHLAPVVVLHRV